MKQLKLCTTCNKNKNLDSFHTHPTAKYGRATICKSCKKNKDHERRLKNLQHYKDVANAREKEWCVSKPKDRLLRQARRRSLKKGVKFSITVEDIIIPQACPYLGIPLFRGESKVCANSPSVDEIIPGKGYVKGNVQIVSAKANTMKSNATPAQLLMFSKRIIAQFRA